MDSAIISVLVLGILIFVHELGHFLFAKWTGVGVLEFAIGFGPKLLRWTWGDTTYSLRAIPLGGFVRMVGDDPTRLEASDTAVELSPQEARLLQDRNRWFVNKGLLARSSIVFAGPLFNFLFAFIAGVFAFAIWGAGELVNEPIIGDLVPGYPAEKAGLKSEDRVEQVDGVAMLTWEQLASTITGSAGKTLDLKVKRGSETINLKLAGEPESAELQILNDGPAKDQGKQVKIGIMPKTELKPVSLGDSIVYSGLRTWQLTKLTVKGLWGMLSGLISPKNIAGPIFIFKEAANSADRGMERVLGFMIFLSVSLAVLNLLPIPVLDGGHLLFFLIEAIKGSPISIRTLQYANQFGMAILFALMIFALGNDILRLAQ